jgi:protoporphyrinogen oxidase
MWERCREKVEAAGGKVRMHTWVSSIRHRDGRAIAVMASSEGGTTTYDVDSVVSSMPLSELVLAMDPPPPADVVAAAKGLRYRDFLTVALVVPERFSFPDNWIYIHSPGVRVGRIQNFGSWSPYLVKDGKTCLGLEYFVNEGDELWTATDDELVALGEREIAKLGLVSAGAAEAGYVVRMPKAYPVYDADYRGFVDTIRGWLEANVPNVHPVGRNGMHKYNNQDHSMLTAQLTVKNILGATPPHDIWQVNVEDDYHEEQTGKVATLTSGAAAYPSGTGRQAPFHPRREETAA